ncbi:MAG TPA: phosphohistidine phosphatase SixA [Bacteroidota bacterium]|nr:phosphohistidine phosphatase SixA [Bacteroidota bacterium]
MNLYLLRHAIAVEPGWKPGASDAERPLSGEGKKKMRKIALGMKALELSFDLILSSRYLRAQETARIVVEELDAACGVVFTSHLEVGGDPAALMEEVAARGKGAESILLVGHEPQLSRLISYLLAGNSGLGVTMKKGGLCKLDVARLRYARTASLEWLLTPSQLAHIAP